MEEKLTHIDENGRPRMVNVEKRLTRSGSLWQRAASIWHRRR